jgi:RNA polymerase sigma factor (sigma-70 family)
MPKITWLDWSKTSSAWVHDLIAKDEAAWERFMLRRKPGIIKYAKSFGLSDFDSDDIAAKLISKLWTDISNNNFIYDSSKSFNSLLLKITANLINDKFRGEKRSPKFVAGDNSLLTNQILTEWELQEDLITDNFKKIVAILPRLYPKAWEIWRMKILESRSVSQIAQELNISRGAVHTAIWRVNEEIKKFMIDKS